MTGPTPPAADVANWPHPPCPHGRVIHDGCDTPGPWREDFGGYYVMGPPPDIVAWLLARLDEDEVTARALNDARPGPWQMDTEPAGAPGATAVRDRNGQLVFLSRGGVPADYVIQWSPARILAEIAAKRTLLAGHTTCHTGAGPCGDWTGSYTCIIAPDLARPYADRPDWHPSWSHADA